MTRPPKRELTKELRGVLARLPARPRRPQYRALHIAGTAAGVGCAAMFLLSGGRPRWLLAGLASAYGSAWMGHALFEKNTPATFSHPLWSVRGDLRMVRMALSGDARRRVAPRRHRKIHGRASGRSERQRPEKQGTGEHLRRQARSPLTMDFMKNVLACAAVLLAISSLASSG